MKKARHKIAFTLVGWACQPNNETATSSLGEVVSQNGDNISTETDHVSTPLGIFASKSVSCWHGNADLHKKVAFTLAEVLITLGIIGIVAALTIPSLIQKYNEKVTITRLKQTVSLLQNAYNYSKMENDKIEVALNSDLYEGGRYDKVFQNDFAHYFTKYLATDDECGTNCFAKQIKSISGAIYISDTRIQNTYKQAVLNNGVSLLFMGEDNDCSNTVEGYWHICGRVYIDVDGKKRSTLGKDTFLFYIKSDSGLIPSGITSDNTTIADCYRLGTTCTNWILTNQNMDYLHCDDLSWSGKTRCK